MQSMDTKTADLIAGPFFLLFSVIFLYNMDTFIDVGLPSVVSPRMFPSFIVCVVGALAFCFTVLAVYRFVREKLAPAAPETRTTEGTEETGSLFGFIVYILILYAYRWMMEYFGFLLSTPLVMLAVAWLLQAKRYVYLIPSFIAFTFLLDYVTFRFIRIALPAGSLFE